jgi:hypothetical protein
MKEEQEQMRLLAGVGFADLVQTDTAVTTFHIGRILAQMGGADVLHTVYLGATVTAFNYGVV